MTPIKTAGSVLSLLNGIWAAYIALAVANTPTSCPNGGCPVTLYTYLPTVLLAAGVVLIAGALASFIGFRSAFMAVAALSLVTLVLVILQWGSYGSSNSLLAVSLSVVAAVIDVIASRPARGLSEEGHPLNLPVFG